MAALTHWGASSPGEAVVVVTVAVVGVPVSDGVGGGAGAAVHAPQSRIADNTKRLILKVPQLDRSRAENIRCGRKLDAEPV
jgi:hypothetical protein